MNRSLGERLKALMYEHRFTQARLARATGLSQAAIWKLLNNKSKPTTSTLQLLAQAFGLSLADITKYLALEEVPDIEDLIQSSSRDRTTVPDISTGKQELIDELGTTLLELLRYPNAVSHAAKFLQDADARGITLEDDPEFLLQNLEEILLKAKREYRALRRQQREREREMGEEGIRPEKPRRIAEQ